MAANGDAANKIGTSGVAVLAKHYGIPFYVLGPTSTIDLACSTGEQIHIEERPPEEVTEKWYVHRMAPDKVKVYNPAFDVTPRNLITAVITEKGLHTLLLPILSENGWNRRLLIVCKTSWHLFFLNYDKMSYLRGRFELFGFGIEAGKIFYVLIVMVLSCASFCRRKCETFSL